MRKPVVFGAALCAALSFFSCSDDSVFVLGNIPFAEFFENEADSFDAYSGATQKVANGSLTYGLYHEKTADASKATFGGIMFPVKVSRAALEKSGFTEVTDASGTFELSTSAKGNTTTLRYQGKQNLYQSASHSYYILSEKPSYYKEASLKEGKLVFGKIAGKAASLPLLYIAQKADPKHTKGAEYAIYTDAEGSRPLSFEDGDTAKNAADGSDVKLNTVRAVVAETSGGKKYALTILGGVWRGSEFGVSAGSELAGKKIVSLTFITEKGLYTAKSFVLGSSEKIDGKTKVWFAEGSASQEFTVSVNYGAK